MKVRLPKILSFKKYLDEYSKTPEKVEIGIGEKEPKLLLFEEEDFAKTKRENIISLLKKHESVLRELEDAMIDYHREMIIEHPQVSLMTVKKRSNMTDNEYYNARVIWPGRDGQSEEFRFYIGPKKNFPDINDPKTISEIQSMIANKIMEKRRRTHGWKFVDDHDD